MKNIEDEIRKTMDSLDGLREVPANPFLFAKIKNRITQQNESPTTTEIWQWTWAKVAVCMLIVGLNIFTFSKMYFTDDSTSTLSMEEFGVSVGITPAQNVY